MRVIELAGGPAAGFAGLLLAELGHEVIRVSPSDSGSFQEEPTAALSDTERAYLDRRKQGVTLDMVRGREQFLELMRTSDALVEDLGPGGLQRLGIGVETLHEAHPDLVVASISPFGQTGPKAHWQASELVIQASAGPVHSTGFSSDPPAKAGGYAAHHIAGLNAATAVLAARYGSEARNSGGVHLDISMQETYVHHWTRHIGEWAYSGTRMRRERPGFGHQGFRHTAMASDGWLYVLSLYASWEEIAAFFGLDRFITEEWGNAEYRMEHWPELEGPYHEVVASKSRYEWFRLAAEAGYTFAPVHSATDQLANVQFEARGFLEDAEVGGQPARAPGLPFTWPQPQTPNRPPAPDEHNALYFGDPPGGA